MKSTLLLTISLFATYLAFGNNQPVSGKQPIPVNFLSTLFSTKDADKAVLSDP